MMTMSNKWVLRYATTAVMPRVDWAIVAGASCVLCRLSTAVIIMPQDNVHGDKDSGGGDDGSTAGSKAADAGDGLAVQAYAAARMAESVLRGLAGEDGIYECAFVQSDVTELPFFASKVRLGPEGAEEVLPLGDLAEVEQKGLQEMISILKGNIDKGVAFANEK